MTTASNNPTSAGARRRGNDDGRSPSRPPREERPSPVERGEAEAKQVLEGAQQRVARERVPRWQALRRGRVVLLAYAVVVLIVLALALAAHAFSVLPGDLPFTRELQETTLPGLAGLMQAVTFLGNPSQAIIIDALAIALLVALKMPLEAFFVLLTALTDAVGGLLKIVVGRNRPATDLVHVFQIVKTPSFPSGHTLHFTVFYGFLIFILAINLRRSWLRDAVIAVFAALIALVGLSRIYLGEHWLSDVIGGYLVGALCLVPLIAGYLWARAHVVVTARPPFVRRREVTTP